MPQDIGNGVTHWGANETKEFYKYWDSPARKENAAARAAEDDKRSPLEKKRHSRRQRQAIRNFQRRKQSSKVTEESGPSKWGPGRDHSNHRIMPHGNAYEQQKARLTKRKEKQRMAGERMEMLNQQNNSNTFKYEKNKYDKRKDYRMS